jgi:6,7-dimethyl-8-ribityllumazine synthase
MATALKNLSDYDFNKIPILSGKSIGIIISEWNYEITGSMADAAIDTLQKQGFERSNILIHHVPGSFELPLGAQLLLENSDVNAVICIGCVIQGETRHFDFICQAVSQKLMELNTEFSVPIIFGVLTTSTQQQAIDRAGGKHGNKGIEAAVAAIKMIHLQDTLENQ